MNPYEDQGGQPAPEDPGYVGGTGGGDATAPITDDQINEALNPYGQWQEVDGYGRVWVPDSNVVGADFQPYETCGSWAYTDYGWTFDCDWDWGWVPFHYGSWGWFDGYWGWQPGYDWGPAWVDWSGGGGYVGWRPSAPHPVHGGTGNVHGNGDHRVTVKQWQSHWRYAKEGDLGKPHIRSHLAANYAEAAHAVHEINKPAFRGEHGTVKASTVMHGREAQRSRERGNTGRVTTGGHERGGNQGEIRSRHREQSREREQPTWQRERAERNRQSVRQNPSNGPTQRERPSHSRNTGGSSHHVNRGPSSSSHFSGGHSSGSHSSSHSSGGSHSSGSSSHSSGGSSHSSGGSSHSSGGGGHSGGHHR